MNTPEYVLLLCKYTFCLIFILKDVFRQCRFLCQCRVLVKFVPVWFRVATAYAVRTHSIFHDSLLVSTFVYYLCQLLIITKWSQQVCSLYIAASLCQIKIKKKIADLSGRSRVPFSAQVSLEYVNVCEYGICVWYMYF